MRFFSFLLFLLFTPLLEATLVGNPAMPTFFQESLFSKKDRAVTLRFGYFFDNIYKTKFHDEVINDEQINNVTDQEPSASSIVQLQTHSAMVILNLKRYLDVYGLIGQSRIRIEEREDLSDSLFSTQNNLSWGAGATLTVLKYKGFGIGADGKYFYTKQEANYLVTGDCPAIITTEDFGFIYEEIQGSLAFSYDINPLCPYLGVSYVHATIASFPSNKGIVRLSSDPTYPREFECKKSVNSKHWGMSLGASIVAKEKIAINIESRLFNQNAVNISAEVRF